MPRPLFEVTMIQLLEDFPLCSFDTMNDLAEQILEINLEQLKKNEAAVLKTLDPEAIHGMRVATRRLRVAMKVFHGILPAERKKIQVKLQKLFHVLGEKRDMDIFSEFLFHSINVKASSFPKSARRMDQSQKKIILMLKSKSYANLIKSLDGLKTKPAHQKKQVLNSMRKQVQKALNKVVQVAPFIDSRADNKTLHELRISIKKLRYICEFFEPILSKTICLLGSFIEKTKEIQDILGEHQDAITGISMLVSYRKQFSSEDFLKIKKKYEQSKKITRTSFFRVWKGYLF